MRPQLKRSLILAVQFEQVEGVQDNVSVTATGVQLIEQGKPGLGAEDHGLTVDRCGSHRSDCEGPTYARKAVDHSCPRLRTGAPCDLPGAP